MGNTPNGLPAGLTPDQPKPGGENLPAGLTADKPKPVKSTVAAQHDPNMPAGLTPDVTPIPPSAPAQQATGTPSSTEKEVGFWDSVKDRVKHAILDNEGPGWLPWDAAVKMGWIHDPRDMSNIKPTTDNEAVNSLMARGASLDKVSVASEKYQMDRIRQEQQLHALQPAEGETRLLSPERFLTEKEKEQHPVLYGLAHVAGSLSTQENAMIMLGSGGLGTFGELAAVSPEMGALANVVAKTPRMVSAYFAGQMGYQTAKAIPGLVEAKKEYDKAMEAGDVDRANKIMWDMKEGATETALTAYMSYAAAHHAIKGTPEPVAEIAGRLVRGATGLAADGAKAAGRTTAELGKGVVDAAGEQVGKVLGEAQSVPDAVKRMVRVGGKKGTIIKDKIENTQDDLTHILQQDKKGEITSPGTFADAIDNHARSAIEAPLQQEAGAAKDSTESVVPNFRQRAQERLDKFFSDNPEFSSPDEKSTITENIMSQLERETDHGNGLTTKRDPNLYEAEGIRRKFGKYEPTDTNGQRSANYEMGKFMREMIDEAYDAKGVTGVKEARTKEQDLIDISDALRNAQAFMDKQGQIPALMNLFKKGKLYGAMAAMALHFNVPGLLALGGGMAFDTIVKNLKDAGVNTERAIELANRATEKQATVPEVGQAPGPVQGPQGPGPEGGAGPAPVRPGVPPPPQPPAPATRPATNHLIHGELASYFDEDKDESDYNDLLQRYSNRKQLIKNMIEDARAKGQELTDGAKAQVQRFKDLQRFINKQHAAEDVKVEAENKKLQEKYQKDLAKYNADRAKEAQTQKDNVAAAAALAQQKAKEDQAALLTDERVAHGPVMKALDPVHPIESASGKTSDEAHGHEHGHIMAHVAEGHDPFQMVSNLHPDAKEAGAAASVHTDVSDSVDTGIDGIERRVVGVLGGPAWDEVHSGLPMSKNTGARSDIAQARKILREEAGLSGDDLNKVFDELYERAKGHVSNPEALAIVNANKGLREVGLHDNYHISPGRMAEYVKKLKGAFNNGKTPTTSGVREGATDRGVQKGESAGAGDRAGEQNGLSEEVPAKEARKSDEGAERGGPKRVKESVEREIPIPKKRTTGKPEIDRAIEEGGGIPGGVQKGFEYVDKEGKTQSFPDTAYVHEPTTGTSLNFPLDQITPDFVRQRLEEKRAEYAAAKGPKTEASNVDATPEMKREVAKSKWSGNEYYRSLETTNKLGDTNLMYQTRPEDGGYGRIIMSQVDPEMRGQGIGKEIYRSLFADAQKRGLKGMKSDTSVSREAQHVWDSLKASGLPIVKRDVVPGGGNGGRQVEYTLDFQKPAAMEASHVSSDEEKGLISTRQPSGKKATENPLEGDILHIGREAIDRVPGMADKVAAKIKKYAGIAVPKEIRGDSAKVIDHFTNYLKDNLKEMYNRVDPAKAEQTRKWYESANKFAHDLAVKHGLTDQQMAGVIAAMSPQKDWDQNVSLAERVVDTYKNHQDKVTSPEMMDRGRELAKQRNAKGKLTNPSLKAILPKLEGKTLAQIENPVDKAAWVRLHDETSNPRNYSKIDPGTGNKMGDVLSDTGEPKSVAWGSLKEIAKALGVLQDGSRENISNLMGEAHKVRNFYNNILDPSNPNAVTIDTHAVAAAHYQPFSGKSLEVKNNFGGLGSKMTGAKGLYGIYADAYRSAAKELGVLPRELQSVVWEEVRDMFPDEFKRAAGGKHVEAIQRLWKGYDKGNMTLPETRQAISDYAAREYAALKSRKPGAEAPEEYEGYTQRMPLPKKYFEGIQLKSPGITEDAVHHHEWGHALMGALNGFESHGIVSHRHPAVKRMPGTLAAAAFAAKSVTPENLETFMHRVVAGGAANEAIDGVARKDNVGLGGDMYNAKRYLNAVGIPEAEHEAYINKAMDQVKELLTKPGVSDLIREAAATREDNLPVEFHHSQNKVNHYLDKLKGILYGEPHGEQGTGNPTRVSGEGDQGSGAVAGREESGTPREAAPAPAGKLKKFSPPKNTYTVEIRHADGTNETRTIQAKNFRDARKVAGQIPGEWVAQQIHSEQKPVVGEP